MNIIEAIILGIVQGLTEFIPVSSSGHLVLMHDLLGVSQLGLTFDVALHIGTLTALCIFFWRDIKKLWHGLLGRNNYRLTAWLITFATIPAVIFGVLLQDLAEDSFRSTWLVAVNLALVGLLMMAAEWFAQRHKRPVKKIQDVSLKQALAIGFAQVLALVPGVSRSGSTITAGLFTGLDRVAATRFSFLLAIPITFGAIIKVLLDESSIVHFGDNIDIFTAGIISALISGLFAIRFLLFFLAQHSLRAFAYYRIALAVLVLLFLGIN